MRLIDADKLIRIYYDDADGNKTFEFVPAEFIDAAPTIDAVPVRHGEWIDVEHAPNDMWYCTCSLCGGRQTVGIEKLINFNYCPNCGADMRGKDREDVRG